MSSVCLYTQTSSQSIIMFKNEAADKVSDMCFKTYQRKLSCSLKFDKCHVVSLMLTLRRLRLPDVYKGT